MQLLKYEGTNFYRQKKIIGLLLLVATLALLVATLYNQQEKVPEGIERTRLTAAVKATDGSPTQQKTLHNYLDHSIDFYTDSLTRMDFPDKYFTFHNYYGRSDASYQFSYNLTWYQTLQHSTRPLTKNLIEERTAAQFLLRAYPLILPLLLIFACFAWADLLLQDRRHASLVYGFPVTNPRKLLAKFLVGLSFSVATFLLFGGIVFLVTGLQNSFGSLSLQVPTYVGYLRGDVEQGFINAIAHEDLFRLLPIWQLLAETFGIFLLFSASFLAVTLLITLLIPHVTLPIFLLCPLAALAYLPKERFSGFYNDFVTWLPWNYLQITPVLTGFTQQWLGSQHLHLTRGLLLYSISFGVASLLLLLFRKRLSRY